MIISSPKYLNSTLEAEKILKSGESVPPLSDTGKISDSVITNNLGEKIWIPMQRHTLSSSIPCIPRATALRQNT